MTHPAIIQKQLQDFYLTHERFESVRESAIKDYMNTLQKRQDLIAFLGDKEFKFGQVVKVQNTVYKGGFSYGIICGHILFENPELMSDGYYMSKDPYRVFFSQEQPFSSIQKGRIHSLENWNEVPTNLRNYEVRIYLGSDRYIPIDIDTFI